MATLKHKNKLKRLGIMDNSEFSALLEQLNLKPYQTNTFNCITNRFNEFVEMVVYKNDFNVTTGNFGGIDTITGELLIKSSDKTRKFVEIDGVLTPVVENAPKIEAVKHTIENSRKRALDNIYGYVLANYWDYFVTLYLGLALGFIFLVTCLPINNKARAYAVTGETYTYSGTLSSDTTDIADYAVSSIETLTTTGYPIIRYDIDLTSYDENHMVQLASVSSLTSISTKFLRSLNYNTNSNQVDFNFGIFQTSFHVASSHQIVLMCNEYNASDNLYHGDIYLKGAVTYTIYFTTAFVAGGYPDGATFLFNEYSKKIIRDYSQDLTSVVDMESKTDYNINFTANNAFYNDASSSSLSSGFAGYLNNNRNLNNFSWSNDNWYNADGYIYYYTEGHNQPSSFFNINGLYLLGNSSYTYNFENLDFQIKKPSYRVDNTLVMYTYDYPTLFSNINGVEYSLSKNDNLYIVGYNGSLPNSRFAYISCNDISNTIFDEYIYLKYKFNSNNVITSPNYSLGFDFNFVYHNDPLVASNGVYNYNFEKPSYVAMNWSLNPFHIPVLEAVENVVIFLVFYCPVISNILTFVHLDLFLGALINILNYFISGVVGQFVVACLSFIIFFAIMKSLLPMGVGSLNLINKDWQENGYYFTRAYNSIKERRYLRKREKILASRYKPLNMSKYLYNSNKNGKPYRRALAGKKFYVADRTKRGKLNSSLHRSMVNIAKMKNRGD